MNFSLAIYSSPYSDTSISAFRFAEALLSSGHQLKRVFFYHNGVYHGSQLSQLPQDQWNITEAWCALKRIHVFELCVCIAAGLKRGIYNQEEAERYGQDNATIAEGFDLVGLGELIDAAANSDRLITFGDSA